MEYKIGDKVRIISNKSGHRYKIGEVLLIEEVDINGSYGGYLIDRHRWWFTSKCCELVNPMEDNKTSEEQPMTAVNGICNELCDSFPNCKPCGGEKFIEKSISFIKDKNINALKYLLETKNAEIERLNKEVERLSICSCKRQLSTGKCSVCDNDE